MVPKKKGVINVFTKEGSKRRWVVAVGTKRWLVVTADTYRRKVVIYFFVAREGGFLLLVP